MSASNCLCGSAAKNMGQPLCIGNLDLASKIVFTSVKNSAGLFNSILMADTVDDTYVTGMIQTGDKLNVSTTDDFSQRWFPTQEIKAYDSTREEENTFELDGFDLVTSDGNRTISGTFSKGASPQLYAALKSRSCLIDAFYVWSITNQIGGNGNVDGTGSAANQLRPFKMEPKTLKVNFAPVSKANETPDLVTFSFMLSSLEDDGNIAFIEEGDGTLEVGLNITSEFTGLTDVVMGAATAITTTTFTVDMRLIYGSQAGKQPFTGGVLADFDLNEISPTPAPIVITTVDEISDGVYDFTIPAATSADVLELTLFKETFFSLPITITIP